MTDLKQSEYRKFDGGVAILGGLIVYSIGATTYEYFTGRDVPTFDDLF